MVRRPAAAKAAPAKRAPAKRTTPESEPSPAVKAARAKKVVNARTPTAPSPAKFSPPPEPDLQLPEDEPEHRVYGAATADLEIRLGNRIVFLQPVVSHTYQMSFTNGILLLQAQTEAATPPPPDAIEDQQDGPEDGEVPPEPNPDVVLQVHTGDR